jgi:hypothetical protein
MDSRHSIGQFCGGAAGKVVARTIKNRNNHRSDVELPGTVRGTSKIDDGYVRPFPKSSQGPRGMKNETEEFQL